MRDPKKIPSSPAALMAGLSQEQLRRRILQGEIKGEISSGGRFLVDQASLNEWIARQHDGEPQPAA
jgi:hypothetical protein